MSSNTVNENIKQAHVTALKEVDIEPGKSFTANGRKYSVNESFAIGRFHQVVLMEEELMLLGSRSSCHEEMKKAMDLINNHKLGEAYVVLFNKIESDNKSEQLIPYLLRLCTAYINYEGEDVGVLTDELISEKIEDWSKEGLDVRPFFAFAAIVYKQLLESYKQPIAAILAEAQTIGEAMKSLKDTDLDIKS